MKPDWLEEFEPIHPSSYTTAVTVTMYGSLLGRLGRVDECLGVLREAVRQAVEVRNKAAAASTFLTEVTWALRLRPEEVTLESLQQWAPTWRKANDHNRMQWLLAVAAYRLALDGCHEEAATLIGGISEASERVRAPLEEGSRLAREAIGERAFDERAADGGSMTLVGLYDLLMGASPCA